MTNFQLLDTIADAYNPTLLVVALALTAISAVKKSFSPIARLIAVTFIVYGFMFLDMQLKIWAYFSSDYSTHTAAALGLTIHVGFLVRTIYVRYQVLFLFLSYCVLMHYQGYHTTWDMVSTILVMFIPLAIIYWKEIKFLQSRAGANI